ncbi:2-oxo acid dehydrogenase subunit E2 [Buchnera aphidicola]|uniref:Dihydrolipoamide acetyltransferase component of pyruvate dehydrogenase complex n=1 Tax=Buchnera aphidicola subsp. Uroleucon sonchi TaxID=118118 RepID=A0A6C1FGR8_BUCUN|nr:2-oxo acid dehydrogenase subunit E2 [Buchnera aphidicola]QIE01939.1 dihydrolipoamide acetyltransferase [Buchnera aphidicola (Uroleucon sonchi)]
MPDIGADELEVIEILVNLNEHIELEQGLITVEGDKTSMEIPSPHTGVVKEIYIQIGSKVKINSAIMMLEVDNENTFSSNTKKQQSDLLNNFKKDKICHATPVIRRLARNLNIDLHKVIATGPKNRILKKDLELYQHNYLEKNNQINHHNSNKLSTLELELNSNQKIVSYNLHQNWINIPHVTQFDEVNVTVLEEFRRNYNTKKKHHTQIHHNITMLVFIIKVVSYALEKFPIFNSSLSVDNKKIILKKYINIGIAVDVNDELYVPVLKNTNKKNIEQLSNELRCLLKKAKSKKLKISDMTSGSFTISNLGSIGGSFFSPIINAPEVAILGVSKIQIKPWWNGKEFIPSSILPLSLSYDHRVINGANAARFITFINQILSDIHFFIM